MVCKMVKLALLAYGVALCMQVMYAESDFKCTVVANSGIQLSHEVNESFHIYDKTEVKKNKVAIFLVCTNATADNSSDAKGTFYRLGCSIKRHETEAYAKIMSSQTNSSYCLDASAYADEMADSEAYTAAMETDAQTDTDAGSDEPGQPNTTATTKAVGSSISSDANTGNIDLASVDAGVYKGTTTPGVDSDVGDGNNATTTTTVETTEPREWAVLQVLDGDGTVVEDASTVQTIRLRAQGLTSADYQPPLIEDCWYSLYGQETNETGAMFVQRGCDFAGDVSLIEVDRLSKVFTANGPTEVQTALFDLMPLYEMDFTDIVFTCTINVCTMNQTCQARCPAESNAYTVINEIKVNASTQVSVMKQLPTTTKAPTTRDIVARVPVKSLTSGPINVKVEKAGLDKYDSYITVGSLVIGVLVLLVLAYLLFRITRSNTEPRPDYPNCNSGDFTGKPPDKPTATPVNGQYVQNGLKSPGGPVPSPPPRYTSGSNIRSLVPAHSAAYGAPVNTNSRLLATRSPEPAGPNYGVSANTRSPTRIMELDRATRTMELDRPTRFQDTRPISTAVGGEFCPQPGVGHSARAPGEVGIVSRALEEYFDKHTMNRPFPAMRRPPPVTSPRLVYVDDVQPQQPRQVIVRNAEPAQNGYVAPAQTNAQLLRARPAVTRADVLSPHANLIHEFQATHMDRFSTRSQEARPNLTGEVDEQPSAPSKGQAGILSRALEEYLERHLYADTRR